MLNLVCMGFSMIDQSLVDTVDLYILDGKDLPIRHTEELIDAYVKLIEQNAELHKANEKHKAQLKSLIQCSDMSTGNEPSLSVFQREIDISKELISYE